MEAGGLTSLLTLLKSSGDETIHRVAAGAIANLAMNGKCCIRYLIHYVLCGDIAEINAILLNGYFLHLIFIFHV